MIPNEFPDSISDQSRITPQNITNKTESIYSIRVASQLQGKEGKMKARKKKMRRLHEKTRAAAAPRKPKKGAVSSPLKVDAIGLTTKIASESDPGPDAPVIFSRFSSSLMKL